MMKKNEYNKSIYFSCSTSYGNLGDLVINKMLVDELCKYKKVYVDTYGVPQKFIAPLLENPNAIDCFNEFNVSLKGGILMIFKTIIFILKRRIEFVIPSPGPYNPVKDTFLRSLKNNTITFLYKFGGAKVIHIGKCASALQYKKIPYSKRNVDAYYLRSNQSVEYLKLFNDPRKVHYVPDLCFLFNPQFNSSNKKKIAVFDFRLIEGQTSNIINWCKKTIVQLSAQGFKSIFYYQVEGDEKNVEYLFNMVKTLDCEFKNELLWFNDLNFYEDKMFVFSNRLHSLLIGASYNVYPVCYYDETPGTLKLKHVFSSSMSDVMIYSNKMPNDVDFEKFYFDNINCISNKVLDNSITCKKIIEHIFVK